jgi:hypothetical protein
VRGICFNERRDISGNALNIDTSPFYIVARQPGAENPAIPTWACRADNPAGLAADSAAQVERREVDGVPGAFQLLDVLSAEECERLLDLSESLGYLEDAAVSLPRDIRHNDSFTWVADDMTCEILWRRCRALVHDDSAYNAGKAVLGLNARFRFYRYREGDYFAPHTDGSWPGSRVVDGELVDNAYPDRWSQFSFLLFLSGGYAGGATRFHVDRGTVDVRTPRGGALCFPHGTHPLHCVHSSTPIESGAKYIIRSDVLFDL